MSTPPNTKPSRIPLILFLLAIPFLIWAWYRYPGSLTFAGIFWGTVAVVFGSAFLLNRRKKTNDVLMRQKIQELQLQGTLLYHETIAPLDVNDVAKLQGTIQKMYAGVAVLAGVGLSIIYFFMDGGVWSYAIFTTVLLLILYAMVQGRREYLRMAKENRKTIFRGIISNRFEKEEGSDDDKTTVYYLRIGERDFKVEQTFYDRYPVGTAAEIHFAVDKHGGLFVFSDQVIPVSNAPQ